MGEAYDKTQTAWWRDRLAGKQVPLHLDTPMRGFYRFRPDKSAGFEPVAYWYAGGELKCLRNGKSITYGEDIWAQCAENPVEFEVYEGVVKRGEAWPDEIRGTNAAGEEQSTMIGHNTLSDDDAVLGDIDEWVTRARKASKKGPPANADEADALSDLATKLSDLTKDAEERRLKQTAPLTAKAKEIKARFDKHIVPGDEMARTLKNLVMNWQKAERLRREEEARKILEAAGPDVADVVTVEVEKVRSGTRRAVTTVKQRVVEIQDLKAVAGYIAAMESPPADFLEACRKSAYRLLNAGVVVPGATMETKEVAR